MQVGNFSSYGKSQVTFNGYARKTNVIKPYQNVQKKELLVTTKSAAKGVIGLAKKMTSKESFKIVGKGIIDTIKFTLRTFNNNLISTKEVLTNKAIVNGKVVRPLTLGMKMMSPMGILAGLSIMSTCTVPGLLYGAALVGVSGLYAYNKLIKKQIVPFKDRNPMEIAAKLTKMYNKKKPLKYVTVQEVETHLKNFSITSLKDIKPREIISKFKNFIEKPGIKKQIDLVTPRRNIWVR